MKPKNPFRNIDKRKIFARLRRDLAFELKISVPKLISLIFRGRPLVSIFRERPLVSIFREIVDSAANQRTAGRRLLFRVSAPLHCSRYLASTMRRIHGTISHGYDGRSMGSSNTSCPKVCQRC